MELRREDPVHVLDLGSEGLRFTPDTVAELLVHLADVAAAPAPRALVTTATGKSWALGLDLEWILANPDRMDELVQAMHELLARLLELPVPTVAAIGGHAFAGGAMLALAHDFRVMRADRGYFCLPEIDLAIPFTPGLTALIAGRLPARSAHEAMITGRRYGGPEAIFAGMVDRVAEADDVVPAAVEIAAGLAGRDARTLGQIKTELYAATLAALRDRDANRRAAVREPSGGR